jgi:GT2 family glycosyltransferase
MEILIIKSVFCPNDEHFNITIKSIIKLNMFLNLLKTKFNKIKFNLLLIGWVYKYKINLNTIFGIIENEFDNIYTEYWSINYGKYKILNYSIDFINKYDHHSIIYMDHDIHFDVSVINNFSNIVKLCDNRQSQIGLIAFNQKEDNRHQLNIYENESQLDNEHILWPITNGAIATGSFIISSDILKKLDHFELKTVYGLDDYYLCTKIFKLGYTNIVLKNCYVYHPFDNNNKYNIWKKNNTIKTINNEINYYQNIEHSMNFFTIL